MKWELIPAKSGQDFSVKKGTSMGFSSRRGRPRTDRPKFDLGTPEMIMKRAALCPQDPTLSTSPIDAMLGRGNLTAEEHGAASHFRALRKITFGPASVQAIDLTQVSHAQGGDDDYPDAERRYRNGCMALRSDGAALGAAVFATFERIVVYGCWPNWLAVGCKLSKDWEALLFARGIKKILEWHEGAS